MEQIANFPPIPFGDYRMPPPIEEFKLSTDEEYLYEIATTVSTGQCSDRLANKRVSRIHSARWLTTASRVLRFYVTEKYPSNNLYDLAKYIMHVYVPTYFNVKYRYSCTFGSIHFFNLIKYSRYLSPHHLSVIRETCNNNPYFAHSENILLSMIYNRDPKIRQLGFQRILRSREMEETVEAESIRSYVHPIIQFDCNYYYEMINWNLAYTEPPFTRDFSYDDLKTRAENGDIIESEIMKVPCHIQATERHIKDVTRVSSNLRTSTSREGALLATLESRSRRSNFDSKKQF